MAGILWVVTAYFWRMHEVPRPLEGITVVPGSVLTYGYRLFAATVGSVFFLNLFRLVFGGRDVKVLRFAGMVSLELYVVHLAFGTQLRQLAEGVAESGGLIVTNITDFILRTVICMSFIVLASRSAMVKAMLFGKVQSKGHGSNGNA